VGVGALCAWSLVGPSEELPDNRQDPPWIDGSIGCGFLHAVAEPRNVDKVTLGYDSMFKDRKRSILDVDLTVTLWQLDGQKVEFKRVWARWTSPDVKVVEVPSHPYQKMQVRGTAQQGATRVKFEQTILIE
jgi:hypothetical protein